MSLEEALNEYPSFKEFYGKDEKTKEIVELAYRMVGKIRSQGRHAGGLIIANVPLQEYVPLTLSGSSGNKVWTSAWTEGMAATQLSKFGLVKFDLLGLSNMVYIWNCCKLIKENRDIDIDFDDIDPEDDRAGWITYLDGKREKILINDPKALKEADEVRVDSVFQFDTPFFKQILKKGGVKSFTDLVVYNALGRPGPLPMIDIYIKNRDDPNDSWKKDLHPKLFDILEETLGIIIFQESLASVWTELCGFTLPEAQAARKAVSKKKVEQLEHIGPKVIKGATPILGKKEAEELWDKMITFGRYAFNKAHAVAYSIISLRCLWLKTYFPAEWWAAVLSNCHNTKLVKFMNSARLAGIEFGSLNATRLSIGFGVDGNKVLPGLTSIDRIGHSIAIQLIKSLRGQEFQNLDEFVSIIGPNKVAMERLIKLGAFDYTGHRRRALWLYYLYNYDSGKEHKVFRARFNRCFAWPLKKVKAERKRQADEYFKQYPRRLKIPSKIANWNPSTPHIKQTAQYNPKIELDKEQLKAYKKIQLSFEQFDQLVEKDFSLREVLQFEKEYLGYYWSSPLDLFVHKDGTDIESAKTRKILECVIEDLELRKTRYGNEYLVLKVTDGVQTARVNIWGNEYYSNDEELFQIGVGVRMEVDWKDTYNSFSAARGVIIMPLEPKEDP